MKQENLLRVFYAGVFLLLLVLALNTFSVFSLRSDLTAKIIEVNELAKPAKIELIRIDSPCTDCFNTNEIASKIKEADLEIIEEKVFTSSSSEAREIINKYGIEKLPTIVLKGEIEKVSIQNFKQQDDVLVFDGIVPPYEDASNGNIIGKVSSIIINDKKCDACADFNLIIQDIVQNGVFIGEKEVIDFSDPKGKELIDKFDIKKLPALLLSKDIDAYSVIAQDIKQLPEKDNYYILESQAPYVETESGKIMGLVGLIIIDDVSCSECYDVTLHKQVLLRYGVFVANESTYDVSSEKGRELLSKYNITEVPTILLSPEADIYLTFKQIWGQVGTIESDGWFVFRAIEQMGVYKDLSTGNVVGQGG